MEKRHGLLPIPLMVKRLELPDIPRIENANNPVSFFSPSFWNHNGTNQHLTVGRGGLPQPLLNYQIVIGNCGQCF